MRYGIFVIETKNYKGWIYGSERDRQWTQVIYKRKERFQNPLRQNCRHTKVLSELTGIPHNLFKLVSRLRAWAWRAAWAKLGSISRSHAAVLVGPLG